MINYKITNDITTLPEARKIREKVFIDEQGFSKEFDEIDNIAYHIVLYYNDKPVAVGRLFNSEENPKSYHIGRLAVIKEMRGKGIGSKVVIALEEQAKKLGGNEVVLSSQMQAKDFYKSLGYTEYGKPYFEEHCEHIEMRKNI